MTGFCPKNQTRGLPTTKHEFQPSVTFVFTCTTVVGDKIAIPSHGWSVTSKMTILVSRLHIPEHGHKIQHTRLLCSRPTEHVIVRNHGKNKVVVIIIIIIIIIIITIIKNVWRKGRAEVHLHLFLTSALEVSGQLRISVETPTILTEVHRSFRQSLQANVRTVLHTLHYHPLYSTPLVPYTSPDYNF